MTTVGDKLYELGGTPVGGHALQPTEVHYLTPTSGAQFSYWKGKVDDDKLDIVIIGVNHVDDLREMIAKQNGGLNEYVEIIQQPEYKNKIVEESNIRFGVDKDLRS